jgi:BlaI family transcriptional regulator, penicillinase repressor
MGADLRSSGSNREREGKLLPQISDAEWTVMRVIWERSPVTANEVVAVLGPTTEWKPKTIHTLLRRLVQKGALTFEKKGREFSFRPLVPESACVREASRSFLRRFFDGELAPFLSCFLEQENLSDKEIAELKRILDRRSV